MPATQGLAAKGKHRSLK